MYDNLNIGITLSGGGARGIAHIGVLAGLELHGIYPSSILGTSAGAIVGSLYAAGFPPEQILEIAVQSNLNRIFRPAMSKRGWSNQRHLKEQLQKFIPFKRIEELPRSFAINLTNLNSGKNEIWTEGPLYAAVMASSAVPGVFQPVEINGQLYLDGGVMNNMPAQMLREKSDFVIGSNVVTKDEKSNRQLSNIRGILSRVFEISLWYRSNLDSSFCDLVIEPRGLDKYHIFNFGRAQELHDLGLRATLASINDLQERLSALRV